MKTKLTPLEELRQEKELAIREAELIEFRLKDQWDYISDNAVSIVFHSALNGILGKLGFSNKVSNPKSKQNDTFGIAGNSFSGVMAYLPLVWEIAQPVLWGLIVKKVKSIFKRKKK